MSIDAAIAIVWDVLKMGFAPIKRGFGYVMSSQSYANNLQQEVRNLEYEAQRVRSAEGVARANLQNIHEWVPNFLASAEEASTEARDLLDIFEGASKTCCRGTIPDPNCRYQFSRKAKSKTDDIQKLILENKDKEISFGDPAPDNISFSGPARREGNDATASVLSASMSVKLGDPGVFESRASMIRNIMDALAGNSMSVFGVHGMGGVGKSTLLEDAEKRIRAQNSFDWVARADVSENPDIKRIQGEIAHWLRLTDLEKQDNVSLRATLLRERLEKDEREKKKVLIILDNLWEKLDLKLVGIPCGHNNKAIGCKLLLTSRYERVLRREMRCDSAFRLGVVEEEEAERLFETMVGGKVEIELEPLVKEALGICAGLPFLIVAISKLFIGTTYPACKCALTQIWSKDTGETGELINKTLQISYDRIKSEEAKSLLQLIAVYGVSKPSLENLLRYGFGLGLFEEESSMEDARNMLSLLIEDLQDSSLLLHSEEGDGFKIHDLVREFVALIISKDRPLLVLKNESLAKLSQDKLQSCRAICFPYVDMKKLPEELVCPELRIFLVFANYRSLEIPNSYFNFMRKLEVLNLTGIRLNCLPSPFQFLKKLHALCLDGCSIDNVASLGELKGLQILSLQNSNIQQLPKEIGQLVELRLLDLNGCSQLRKIEPGVLGSLIKLEELYMENSFDQWNAVEQTPPTNASLSELNDMKNLHTLHVSIPNPSVLPGDLNVKNLTKYEIKIGHLRPFLSSYELLRTLELQWGLSYKRSSTLVLVLGPTSDVLQKGYIRSILGKADRLFLVGMHGNDQSICALSQVGFPKLKYLQVMNSPSVRYILQSPSHTDFKTLESLLLKNLINLEKICCSRTLYSKSFSTLKVVRVEDCNKMEVLFPRSVMRELPQLEELQAVNCKLMRGIVEADDDRGKFELPKLRVLELRALPNAKNFITAGSSPSSSTSDDQVGTQIAFFNGQQVAFPSLETLEVYGLDNLGFMFSPSMVKSLAQLRKLKIRDCKKMEAIITEEEGLGVEILETLSFPMLTDLSLTRLESLTCFSREKCSEEGRSRDCAQSRSSVLFNREVSFPFLDSLRIEELPNLKEIWSDESPLESSNLRSLKVVQCESLSKVISSRSLAKLHKLETLSINDCSLVQEIFNLEGPSANGDVETLSELTTLELNKLGSLRRIWNENPSGIVSFHKLKEFKLDGYDNLEFIFFPSMVKSLPQLKALTVSNCKKMETIIAEEEGLGMEISKTLAFSMLTNLRLDRLKSLKCFSRRKCKIDFFFLSLKIFV
ncbi:probable disease resistance protein At4g27220 [Rhodamnia argentea]|uniref:Probable disease resistance protein At4g27220 n=1 Tax=Rhodamnia argentea TaxID=178133 RepID=A0ABM3HFI9_9MYRT|nr:probable disease resistance protein At4g27220 [Rhodamnia argentea]